MTRREARTVATKAKSVMTDLGWIKQVLVTRAATLYQPYPVEDVSDGWTQNPPESKTCSRKDGLESDGSAIAEHLI